MPAREMFGALGYECSKSDIKIEYSWGDEHIVFWVNEHEFGFSLQQNKFKKSLSEITKEEYIGLMQSIFEQIFNDDSDEEDDF